MEPVLLNFGGRPRARVCLYGKTPAMWVAVFSQPFRWGIVRELKKAGQRWARAHPVGADSLIFFLGKQE